MKKFFNHSFVRILMITLTALLITAGVLGWSWYHRIFGDIPNIESGTYIYIPTGAGFEQVIDSLSQNGIVEDTKSFRWLAEKKKYPAYIKPGRYEVNPGMNHNDLVNLLRSGRQSPLNVTFIMVFIREELAGIIGSQIEADSVEIMSLFSDSAFANQLGLEPEDLWLHCIPNTYEFYWNSSAQDFFRRMKQEYERFWTEEKRNKAERLGRSIREVSVLASIVELESSKAEEKSIIAGVYLNRLRIGMPLQADPTLKFAAGDMHIRRVLNEHKEIDSPYNTYLYKGLPPGPICLPSSQSIDAVLDAEKHNYLYFCADADRPGYHTFTSTYNQHLVNARRYQRYLNRRGIYK